MGLDVYLYKVPISVCQEQNKEDEEKPFNMDEWKARKESESIEHDSSKYPEHMFKIGYFRSSYNGSGFNSVTEELGLPNLYDIFNPGGDYEFVPNWQNALTKTKEAIVQYENINTKYKVFVVTRGLGERYDVPYPRSEKEALDLFLEQEEKYNKAIKNPLFNGSFSNYHGEFHLDDGIKIFAIIHGKGTFGDCEYVVMEQSEDNQNWYKQAYEIVQETIEYVLAQPNPQDYHLHWSG